MTARPARYLAPPAIISALLLGRGAPRWREAERGCFGVVVGFLLRGCSGLGLLCSAVRLEVWGLR